MKNECDNLFSRTDRLSGYQVPSLSKLDVLHIILQHLIKISLPQTYFFLLIYSILGTLYFQALLQPKAKFTSEPTLIWVQSSMNSKSRKYGGAVITIIIITLIATIIMLVRHISLIKIIILIFLEHPCRLITPLHPR